MRKLRLLVSEVGILGTRQTPGSCGGVRVEKAGELVAKGEDRVARECVVVISPNRIQGRNRLFLIVRLLLVAFREFPGHFFRVAPGDRG